MSHGNKHKAPPNESKGKRKASISSDILLTPASSYFVESPPTAITTPYTQGSSSGVFIKAEPIMPPPPDPPSMPPLPKPAIDVSVPPPGHGQLIRAAKLSADMSVNDASISYLAHVVRFFSRNKSDPFKENSDIQVKVSEEVHPEVLFTGMESGDKLRHDGDLNPL